MTLTDALLILLTLGVLALTYALTEVNKKVDKAINNLSHGIDSTARNVFDTLHHKIENLADFVYKKQEPTVTRKTAIKKAVVKKAAPKKSAKKA